MSDRKELFANEPKLLLLTFTFKNKDVNIKEFRAEY
jgi:hypothetical protein